MGLEKYGIVVSCEHCNCVATDDSGSFEITVPVCLNPEGTEGIARLRCAVSPAAHRVELLAWNDAANQPIELSAEVQQRVSAALSHVAEHRICGNRHLCSAEIVRIVEKHG
jgi:hypothetical protein